MFYKYTIIATIIIGIIIGIIYTYYVKNIKKYELVATKVPV